MDRRMLTTFPLSSVQKTNLSRCGFVSVGDLKNVDKSVVSQETGLSSAEVDSIFEAIESETKNKPVPLSALDILKQEEERVPIVSFCEKLDEALGGGVQLGQLTELAGIPGVGKTQLCLQLCCDVQIPSLFGGLDGEAVFIDTEAGFVIDRVAEIVSVTVDHCKQIATQQQHQILQLCCDVQIPSLFGGLDGEAVFIDTEAGFVIDRVAEIVSLCCDVQIPSLFGGLDGEAVFIDTEEGFVIDRVAEIVSVTLCCDVQIPSLFGGLDGEAVFIDTEAGFVIDRVAEIVSVTVDHCKQIASQQRDPGLDEYMKNFTVERLLSRIHLYKCVSESKLLAVVNLLPSVLQQNNKIKLVVIDSVAFHFRHDYEDMSLRTRILTNLAQTLLGIARKYEIAVVVTNQMTTKVRSRGQGHDTSSVVPALGDSWGHACTNRVILEYGNGCRVVSLCKSPSQKPVKVFYQITKDGFRDSMMSFKEETNRSNEDGSESSENPAKRQRYS